MSTFTPKDIEYMLSNAADYGEKLSDWERQFIESVTDQFGRGKELSEKQMEILERIHLKLP